MILKSLVPIIAAKQLSQIHAQLIKNPKPHILNPILGLLSKSSNPQDALFLYNQMLNHPTSHNHYTFTYVLKACSLVHASHKGLEIHAHVIKSGHFSDIFIQNSLLYFYLVESEIFSACKIFNSIPYPDVVSWTSIISGLSKLGLEEEAIFKFASMNVKPNSTTLVSVISACSSIRALRLGKAIHGYSFRNLDGKGIILDNAMLDFYLRCGYIENAEKMFRDMPKRDVVSWTTMVGGYVQSGFCEEAVRVFQDMVRTGEVKPNEATLVNVLSACSSIGALSLGQFVHSYISSQQIEVNGNVGNSLINMYTKCGDVKMASLVFKMLIHKDIICWSTIISGMAMNGYGKQALELFSLMLVHGVSPDDITFLGLLSACSHAGLVYHGLMFFKAMKSIYRITNRMEHYACMVDMYGRAGFLIEAETFIREMPVEAEGPVWGALLNACKIHGDEKMFEKVKQCLVNSKGVSIGTFVLLSNSYAGSNRWDVANKVRDVMRSCGLKKIAGSSWVEVS